MPGSHGQSNQPYPIPVSCPSWVIDGARASRGPIGKLLACLPEADGAVRRGADVSSRRGRA
jgi:hypothetical protein